MVFFDCPKTPKNIDGQLAGKAIYGQVEKEPFAFETAQNSTYGRREISKVGTCFRSEVRYLSSTERYPASSNEKASLPLYLYFTNYLRHPDGNYRTSFQLFYSDKTVTRSGSCIRAYTVGISGNR